MAWNVPPQIRPPAADGRRDLPGLPQQASTRRSISAAARRVNVSSRMRWDDAAVDQMGDAMDQGPGLAGARPGDDPKGNRRAARRVGRLIRGRRGVGRL